MICKEIGHSMFFPSLMLTMTVCLLSQSMSTHDYNQANTCATPQGISTRPRLPSLDAHVTRSPQQVLEHVQQVTDFVPSQCHSSNDQTNIDSRMLELANWTCLLWQL